MPDGGRLEDGSADTGLVMLRKLARDRSGQRSRFRFAAARRG